MASKISIPERLVISQAHSIGGLGLGFDTRAGQIDIWSPTTRHRCDVSSELFYSGAKPRRWIPPLVTRFGVIPRVWWKFDLTSARCHYRYLLVSTVCSSHFVTPSIFLWVLFVTLQETNTKIWHHQTVCRNSRILVKFNQNSDVFEILNIQKPN